MRSWEAGILPLNYSRSASTLNIAGTAACRQPKIMRAENLPPEVPLFIPKDEVQRIRAVLLEKKTPPQRHDFPASQAAKLLLVSSARRTAHKVHIFLFSASKAMRPSHTLQADHQSVAAGNTKSELAQRQSAGFKKVEGVAPPDHRPEPAQKPAEPLGANCARCRPRG